MRIEALIGELTGDPKVARQLCRTVPFDDLKVDWTWPRTRQDAMVRTMPAMTVRPLLQSHPIAGHTALTHPHLELCLVLDGSVVKEDDLYRAELAPALIHLASTVSSALGQPAFLTSLDNEGEAWSYLSMGRGRLYSFDLVAAPRSFPLPPPPFDYELRAAPAVNIAFRPSAWTVDPL